MTSLLPEARSNSGLRAPSTAVMEPPASTLISAACEPACNEMASAAPSTETAAVREDFFMFAPFLIGGEYSRFSTFLQAEGAGSAPFVTVDQTRQITATGPPPGGPWCSAPPDTNTAGQPVIPAITPPTAARAWRVAEISVSSSMV